MTCRYCRGFPLFTQVPNAVRSRVRGRTFLHQRKRDRPCGAQIRFTGLVLVGGRHGAAPSASAAAGAGEHGRCADRPASRPRTVHPRADQHNGVLHKHVRYRKTRRILLCYSSGAFTTVEGSSHCRSLHAVGPRVVHTRW